MHRAYRWTSCHAAATCRRGHGRQVAPPVNSGRCVRSDARTPESHRVRRSGRRVYRRASEGSCMSRTSDGRRLSTRPLHLLCYYRCLSVGRGSRASCQCCCEGSSAIGMGYYKDGVSVLTTAASNSCVVCRTYCASSVEHPHCCRAWVQDDVSPLKHEAVPRL